MGGWYGATACASGDDNNIERRSRNKDENPGKLLSYTAATASSSSVRHRQHWNGWGDGNGMSQSISGNGAVGVEAEREKEGRLVGGGCGCW